MPALAYTLGMIGPAARDAVSVLMPGANDRTKDVRYYSIWALGRIGASDAGAVISAHLNDSESSVREQAKRALETIAFLQMAEQNVLSERGRAKSVASSNEPGLSRFSIHR